MARDVLFARCAPGLEPYLLSEARKLRLSQPEAQPGGVQFTGAIEDVWRANLRLRTASRVLLRVARFPCTDDDALYRGAREADWERFLGPDGTFRVDARCRGSKLDHEVFVSQRVKDAVADSFRERHGVRPSVDLDDPDVRIDVVLTRDRCILSMDSSGLPLHVRGWRKVRGEAPLKETAAAACLMASGWDLRSPLLDPFCGSGALLIEGALLAGGFASGRLRERFAFEGWRGHDARRWRTVSAEARAEGKLPPKLILKGWDSDPEALEGAKENLRAAGLADRVTFEVGDAGDFRPRRGWNAWVVTNPPYGERLQGVLELKPVYGRFGRALRERCGGYTVAVLSGNPLLARELGLSPGRMIPMKNGGLDCQLLVQEMPRSPGPVA